MTGVVHTGVSNRTMFVVLWLMVGLGLMVGGRGMVRCGCHHRNMVGWRCGFMMDGGSGGIRCWLVIDWWGWCVRGWFMVYWLRGGVRSRRWGWWGGIWSRGRGRGYVRLRSVHSRGVGCRSRGVGGCRGSKVGELGESFDPLVV